jgi:hypothetical protein
VTVLYEPGRSSVEDASPRLRLLLVALLVLTMQCAEKPGIRFYPTWPDDMLLSEAWAKGDTSLAYDLLAPDDKTYSSSIPFGVPRQFSPSDFRQFTVVVRGQLPPGYITVRAICLKDDGTVTGAFVEPALIGSNPYFGTSEIGWDEVRKEPGYAAFRVTKLTTDGTWNTLLPRVTPGRYSIFLEKDGKELCANSLTIRGD